jgi:serine/threonine protein kinase
MQLTAERMERLQQLFAEAVELAPDDRNALLAREGAADPALGEELRSLLAAHDSSLTAFDRPVTLARLAESISDETRWTGERLGPWELTRLIGHGGMGTVFEAVRADGQFHKRAAIKFLHRHARGALAVERFRAERQILANLDHPNIATLIDGGVTEDGQPYLVMEYIDGEAINTWAASRSLSCRARVELFLQACAAVESAHQALVVHRDLKPANILVSGDGRVKLLDFGIARLLDADPMPAPAGAPSQPGATAPADATAPRAEVLAFTPDYAAPEQMRAEPASTSMDVFALGPDACHSGSGSIRCSPRRLPRSMRTWMPSWPTRSILMHRAVMRRWPTCGATWNAGATICRCGPARPPASTACASSCGGTAPERWWAPRRFSPSSGPRWWRCGRRMPRGARRATRG